MTNIIFTAIVLFGSIFAGFLGSLVGLGGGLLIVPLLTIFCDVEIHWAIGASLISVIATSAASSTRLMQDGFVNVKLATIMALPSVLGAILGSSIAVKSSGRLIALIFGLFILLITILSFVKLKSQIRVSIKNKNEALDSFDHSTLHDSDFWRKRGGASFCMLIAGLFSGLLGIGSGMLNVMILENVLKLPFKVSSATSTLMIGITAAASGGLYLSKGYINPFITFPVMFGVLIGAYMGSFLVKKISTLALRYLFVSIVFLIAIKMIGQALS